MLDVNEYGVAALEQNALTAISGGSDGCKELAYAIGYAVGWLAYTLYDSINQTEPYTLPF